MFIEIDRPSHFFRKERNAGISLFAEITRGNRLAINISPLCGDDSVPFPYLFAALVLLDVVSVHPRVGLRTITSFEGNVAVGFARDHLYATGNVLLFFLALRIVEQVVYLGRLRLIEFLTLTKLSNRLNSAGLQKLGP